jgi:dipeptidyl aminopeptidase/acylaminoacyl peptidase
MSRGALQTTQIENAVTIPDLYWETAQDEPSYFWLLRKDTARESQRGTHTNCKPCYREGEAVVTRLSNTREKSVTEVNIADYKKRSFSNSQGDTIPYRLFIPQCYNPEIRYPLVLFHHGGGGVGDDNRGNLEGPCPQVTQTVLLGNGNEIQFG